MVEGEFRLLVINDKYKLIFIENNRDSNKGCVQAEGGVGGT